MGECLIIDTMRDRSPPRLKIDLGPYSARVFDELGKTQSLQDADRGRLDEVPAQTFVGGAIAVALDESDGQSLLGKEPGRGASGEARPDDGDIGADFTHGQQAVGWLSG